MNELKCCPFCGTRAFEADKLRNQLHDRLEYIDELEVKIDSLKEELHEANLVIEHNLELEHDRHVAAEEFLKKELSYRDEMIAELEAKCRELTEKLHETELAVEHNRHLADEEQLRGALRYRDGVIHGLKYATRCNGVSGGEVDQ